MVSALGKIMRTNPQIHINGFYCRVEGEKSSHLVVKVLGSRERTLPHYFEVPRLDDPEIAQTALLRKDHPDIEFIDWSPKVIRYKGYSLSCHKSFGDYHYIWHHFNSAIPPDLIEDMDCPGKMELTGKININDPLIEGVDLL